MRAEWKPAVMSGLNRELVDKLTMAAEVVVSAAIVDCPIDLSNLKNSITAEVDETGLVARIGTPVEYAPYVEFGTGEFAEGGNGRKGGWVYDYQGGKGEKGPRFTLGSKPNPFLRPALYGNKEKIIQILLKGKNVT